MILLQPIRINSVLYYKALMSNKMAFSRVFSRSNIILHDYSMIKVLPRTLTIASEAFLYLPFLTLGPNGAPLSFPRSFISKALSNFPRTA